MAMRAFYPVERLDQLRTLQSPLRVQLVAVLRQLGEASVREIAEQMDTRPEGLHYHVRELVAVGMLERVGKRKVSRRMESVYRLPGRDLKIDVDGRLLRLAPKQGAAANALEQRVAIHLHDVVVVQRNHGGHVERDAAQLVAPDLIRESVELPCHRAHTSA